MNRANEVNPASNDAFKSIYAHSSVPTQLQRFFLPSIASTSVSQPTQASTIASTLVSHPLPSTASPTSKQGLNVPSSTIPLQLPTDLQARLQQVQKSIVKPTSIQPLQPQPGTRPNSMVYDFKMKKKSAKRIMVSYDTLVDFETTTLFDTLMTLVSCVSSEISFANRFIVHESQNLWDPKLIINLFSPTHFVELVHFANRLALDPWSFILCALKARARTAETHWSFCKGRNLKSTRCAPSAGTTTLKCWPAAHPRSNRWVTSVSSIFLNTNFV